jgi:hypothetical protein
MTVAHGSCILHWYRKVQSSGNRASGFPIKADYDIFCILQTLAFRMLGLLGETISSTRQTTAM